MNRSAALSLLCLVLIAGAIAAIVMTQTSRTSGQKARYEAGWRMCYACGHQWHMELSEIAAEARRDPTEHGYVQCPECKAWRGMVRVICPKCGKPYTADVEVRTAQGSHFAERKGCPHCGFLYGSETPGGQAPGGGH